MSITLLPLSATHESHLRADKAYPDDPRLISPRRTRPLHQVNNNNPHSPLALRVPILFTTRRAPRSLSFPSPPSTLKSRGRRTALRPASPFKARSGFRSSAPHSYPTAGVLDPLATFCLSNSWPTLCLIINTSLTYHLPSPSSI